MAKIMIIWRESVYKEDFRCQKCKCKCADEFGTPVDNVLCATVNDTEYLFCPDCHDAIARVKPYNGNLEGGLYGEYHGE